MDNLKFSSRIHLWIYNHPFYGISDQVDFFLLAMQQNGYQVTVGREPRPEALNVVIENFSEKTSTILIDFCRSQGKRVAVIMTEHLDFIKNQIFIHGDPLWSQNDYMHPTTQVARIQNLMECVQYIRCFLILGDLPTLLNVSKMIPGIDVRVIPFPKLNFVFSKPAGTPELITNSLLFTGYLTDYRIKIIDVLKQNKFDVISPQYFVSRKKRNEMNQSVKLILNIPQRINWRWLSLMRIVAALRSGRVTVSIGTNDDSKIAACTIQIDITNSEWLYQLKHYIDNWQSLYLKAFDDYTLMATKFAHENNFPHDLLELWSITDGLNRPGN